MIFGDSGNFLSEVAVPVADHFTAADHSGVVGTAKKQ